MLNFIARYYSSLMELLTAPFRAIWRGIRRIFPDADITIISEGDLQSYHQTSFWRFARFAGKVILFVWAVWATYVFIYHRPLLQRRTRQLEESRAAQAQLTADLNAFYQNYSALHKEMNAIDDQLLNDKKLKKETADGLLKRRVNVWANVEMLGTRITALMSEKNYSPEFSKMSDLTLEYELTREENRQLREENRRLENDMYVVGDASVQIYDAVSKITKEKLDKAEKSIGKIKSALNGLGLSEKAVAQMALGVSNQVVGTAILPIELDDSVDQKYRDLADKIELWQGLSRAVQMLPIGAPVNNAAITSKYGGRADPIDGQPAVHRGIDFAGKIGTPLIAVAPGKIVFAGEKNGYGKVVEIDHGLGFTTLYAHLSRINVQRGDSVKPRDIVGLGGNSGRSTGPHLHYEIRYNDKPFNPYSFVKGE